MACQAFGFILRVELLARNGCRLTERQTETATFATFKAHLVTIVQPPLNTLDTLLRRVAIQNGSVAACCQVS